MMLPFARSKSRRRKPRPARRGEEGFTLVELLVVLAIIGLIAALATPQVLRYLGSARVSTTNAQLRSVGSALELYYLDHGAYPEEDPGLSVLIEKPAEDPSWNGPYIKGEGSIQDGWGKPFRYTVSADTGEVVITSLGQDGAEGGEGLNADLEFKAQ
jgi:general secretion pathway protein G